MGSASPVLDGRPAPEDLRPRPGEVLSRLLGGRLALLQPRRGPKAALDALLLAGFCRPRPSEKVLDLGSGLGTAGLLLAWARPDLTVTALEIQPGLAELAWRNAWLNGLQERVAVVRGDLREAGLFPPAAFPAVLANPPYYPLSSSRLGTDAARNLARHELAGSMADWVAAAARWLPPGGRSWWVIKPARLAELLGRLEGEGLWPARLRPVWDSPVGPEVLVLVEGRLSRPVQVQPEAPFSSCPASGAGVWTEARVAGRRDQPGQVQPEAPFFLRPEPGTRVWTEEMTSLLSGRLSGAV